MPTVPRPNRLFVSGLALVIVGAILPFLIVLEILPNTLWLNLVAYASSISGLFLGILSAAAIFEEAKRGDPRDPFED